MFTSDRIFQLLEERGVTAYQMAKAIGFSTSKVSAWKQKGAKPAVDALILIADYFDVSIDYLAGRDDIPNRKDTSMNKEEQ